MCARARVLRVRACVRACMCVRVCVSVWLALLQPVQPVQGLPPRLCEGCVSPCACVPLRTLFDTNAVRGVFVRACKFLRERGGSVVGGWVKEWVGGWECGGWVGKRVGGWVGVWMGG